MSGGPAFIVRGKSLEYAGVIYESGAGEKATIFVSHSSHINEDGTLESIF